MPATQLLKALTTSSKAAKPSLFRSGAKLDNIFKRVVIPPQDRTTIIKQLLERLRSKPMNFNPKTAAFLMGMAKFAAENKVEFNDFVKVAGIGSLIRTAGRGLSRAGRSIENNGLLGSLKKVPGKVKKTWNIATNKKDALRVGLENRGNVSMQEYLPKARQIADQAQQQAQRRLATGAAVAAPVGLYGAGVAKDTADAAFGWDEFNPDNYDMWQKIKMFLGMQRKPGMFDPLDQFGLFR